MTRILISACLALAAGPGFAQDAICSGTGDPGQWIGGNEVESDMATADGFAEQMALVLNANTYASLFTLSESTEVRIEAQGRGNGDPLLALFGPDGTEVTSDDDSGGRGAARSEISLEPGQYCAVIRSFNDAPMTAIVRIGRTDMEPLTDGMQDVPDAPVADGGIAADCDNALDLGPLVAGQPLVSDATPDTTPYLAFTVDAPAPVSITATNVAADPTLLVEDSLGTVLGENDDFDGLNSRVDLPNDLPAGRYCIVLGALNDQSLPITVQVSEFDPAEAMNALFARGEAAPPTQGAYPITDLGTLDSRFGTDVQVAQDTIWYQIDLPEAGLLLAEAIAIGQSGDPWLVLFDDRGRQIAMNDDQDDTTDALLTARLQPGPYMVGLKQVAGGTGFVRFLLERYVPAP